MIMLLKFVGWFIIYLMIPFVIFSINDWFAGFYEDRLDTPTVFNQDHAERVLSTIFWPIVVIILSVLWLNELYKALLRKSKINFRFSDMRKLGKAKRDRDQDLDLQAERFLLGRDDE